MPKSESSRVDNASVETALLVGFDDVTFSFFAAHRDRSRDCTRSHTKELPPHAVPGRGRDYRTRIAVHEKRIVMDSSRGLRIHSVESLVVVLSIPA